MKKDATYLDTENHTKQSYSKVFDTFSGELFELND